MKKQGITKRISAVFLAFAMLISCVTISASANAECYSAESVTGLVGNGTGTSPYSISSAEELLLLQELDEVGYVQLTSDLDMSGCEAQPYVIKKLTGVFDGNGHTISDLSLSGSGGSMWGGSAYTGFVSVLEGSVCNLKLDGISISTSEQYNDIGAVAGYAEGASCSVENCVVTGSITSTTESKYPAADHIGGVIGRSFGYEDTPTAVKLENCAVDVDVTGSKKDYTAGLIAYAAKYTTVTINRCAVFGDITADTEEGYAGGLAARTDSSPTSVEIANSYFAGTVTGSADCARGMVYMTKTGKNAGTLSYGDNCIYTGTCEPNPEANTGTTVTGSAENMTADGIRALTLEGFEIRSGEFDGFPVPVWTAAEPSIPSEPDFVCTVTFENLADGTLTLTKNGKPISAVDGAFNLTETGEYSYTVTDFSDYKDISDTFTLTDGDNGKSKTIWLHPEYKTVEISGEGTAENPYTVSTAAELISLAALVNDGTAADAHVVLNKDITVKGSWTPMGKNAVYPFKGTFDGGNHSVTVTVDDPTLSYFGFFGCLENAAVKNLTVCGEIYCSEPYAYVGGIAARARGNVDIVNCINRATVSAYVRGSAGIGGIVGGYDDNSEYTWEDIRLSVKDCANYGLINTSGTDLGVFVGGIVGSNPNCVQLDGCENHGTVYSAGTWVGGLLGQAGSTMGECTPKISDCESDGALIGANERTHRLYGKGTISSANITDSGDNNYSGGTVADDELLTEICKYRDTAAVLNTAKAGDSIPLLKEGKTVSDDIDVEYIKSEKDLTEGYIECGEDGLTLSKVNDTSVTVSETLTLRLTDSEGNALRKPITVNIYPSEAASRSIMDKIAAKYSNKSDEWTVFDMSVYERLGFGENTTNKNAYLNTAVNKLSKDGVYVSERAKAEIIFASLGVDTAALTAYGAEASFSNAEKLAASELGTSIYNAPWILLAEEAGKLELSDEQRASMIKVLTDASGENGLFFYEWDGFRFDDVDTTATAIAALARFYAANDETAEFIDNAVKGLSATQAANGSYGNVNTDAMVVIGLASMGIDPATDTRFIKDGGSLANAIMLYANDNGDGFVSEYDTDLATEQGFRALIVLEQMKVSDKGTGFNIYTLKAADGIEVVPNVPSNSYTAGTNDGLTEDGNDSGGNADGDGNTDNDGGSGGSGSSSSNITVSVKVLDDKKAEWLSTSVSAAKGATVAELLKKAFSKAGITAEGLDSGYIKSVTYDGKTLAEYDKGDNSGWMYKVNGKTPSKSILSYQLKSGDAVTLYYTEDWTKEDSASSVSGGSGSSSKSYTVKFDTNGGGSIDSISVLKNGTADAPKAPQKEGFEFAGWFTDKALTMPYSFAEKVTGDITLYAKWTENAENASTSAGFADVTSGAWYADAVKYMVECGLMNGISSEEFAPNGNVTRAMFVTVLYRAENEPSVEEAPAFSDVETDSYYADAVIWAYENGVVSGISETEFAPDRNITREQIAALLYRYADYKGIAPEGAWAIRLGYADTEEISDYAAEGVMYCTLKEIMRGKDENRFEPHANATRAETAAIFNRFIEMDK